ncbi:conserved hypothetical protein [Cupriavidus necator]|uniref:Uncharacterized protein n=1 Tax=Cupriavidus necator TaxID=106590 RepID=A0A1K0J2S0_CUPNE|nr:conserved hypothetical protein [Cupriavidus necator]
MNVAELIELLRGYPTDARVVVQGYEFGFDDISLVAGQPLCVGANWLPRPGLRGVPFVPAECGAGAHDEPVSGEAPDEVAVYLKGACRH